MRAGWSVGVVGSGEGYNGIAWGERVFARVAAHVAFFLLREMRKAEIRCRVRCGPAGEFFFEFEHVSLDRPLYYARH
jgi:hypothetical protein